MTNTANAPTSTTTDGHLVRALVGTYAAATLVTLGVLALLDAAAPAQAPQEAWTHGVIVAVLSLLLLLRTRAATHGSARAQRAVRVIAMVLLVANAVEAAVPGLFPAWMRLECVALVALMLATVLAARRAWPTR